MRIGLIVEGSYPYVSGGVSSWVHTIIRQMPHHEFHIISINPSSYTEEDMQYRLPPNVTGLHNLILNQDQKKRSKKRFVLEDRDVQSLEKWLMFEEVDTNALFVMGEVIPSSDRYFTSRAFYEMVKKSYHLEPHHGSFIDFLWMWRGMFEPVIRLLQQEVPEVDLVHSASTGYAGLLGAYMAKGQRIPFYVTEHGIYSREREEEILKASWIPSFYKKHWINFFHHLSRQAYKEADQILTLFENNQNHQLEIGADPEKVAIIPNGVDYERLSRLPSNETERPFRIGAIIRIVPIKDVKTMITAAKILEQRGRDFEWIIMGPLDEDEEYTSKCQILIKQNGLQNKVKLMGKVDIADYLPTFDIGVLTSISEGQPLAVLEGMSAGLPFVVTDVGGCSELIYGRDDDPFGPAGFVVPPVHPDLVADRIEWLMDYPKERNHFGENGQKRVAAFYQYHHMIDQYRELYQTGGTVYGGHRI
ncbi:glycoside hydrolase [Pontibacillus chungwhensis BH030062]|uniref:Glycoside hydrolase n=1 Tax=Pontibacillus chungwhensis BH030062 TaxID=1385513 RepID=A0A0A2UQS3_9BACI|nr:GT4 family glycosyltransferase PelF [Pontibacillus chungwhensis]KGP90284.1 glycoside hydrolase [Pontibacillus chungwhensis BH030062]